MLTECRRIGKSGPGHAAYAPWQLQDKTCHLLLSAEATCRSDPRHASARTPRLRKDFKQILATRDIFSSDVCGVESFEVGGSQQLYKAKGLLVAPAPLRSPQSTKRRARAGLWPLGIGEGRGRERLRPLRPITKTLQAHSQRSWVQTKLNVAFSASPGTALSPEASPNPTC